MTKFPQILRELRKDKGFSQTDVAKALGIQYYTLGKWEQGRAQPSIEDLLRLADYYSISIDYLVGREDDLGNIVSAAPSSTDIFGDEATLLSCFRKLGTYEKEAILIQIKALAGAVEKNAVKQSLDR